MHTVAPIATRRGFATAYEPQPGSSLADLLEDALPAAASQSRAEVAATAREIRFRRGDCVIAALDGEAAADLVRPLEEAAVR